MALYKCEEPVSDTIFEGSELVFDQLNMPLNMLDWTTADYQVELNQEEIVLQHQDETLDAKNDLSVVPEDFVPFTPIGPPARDNFAGDLKFEVEICGADTNRSKYMYSHRLDRIYVDIGYSFSVRFKWDSSVQVHPAMYVRATPVFSDPAQAEKRVTTCIQHYHETSKNGGEMSESRRGCVLHSSREPGTRAVRYCGGAPDAWHSVLVRLAAPAPHAYQFACKNSCTTGINRRPIAVVFTLEDCTGAVWGRRSVGARVCSCPKRDMRRDEAEEAPRGKRPLAPARRAPGSPPPPPPRGKKARLEVRDDCDKLIPLPQVSVIGSLAYTTGLSVMLNIMQERRNTLATHHQPTDQIDSAIAQLRPHLEKVENSPPTQN